MKAFNMNWRQYTTSISKSDLIYCNRPRSIHQWSNHLSVEFNIAFFFSFACFFLCAWNPCWTDRQRSIWQNSRESTSEITKCFSPLYTSSYSVEIKLWQGGNNKIERAARRSKSVYWLEANEIFVCVFSLPWESSHVLKLQAVIRHHCWINKISEVWTQTTV